MSKDFKTAQEEFWAGDFGDEYSKRNVGEMATASNLSLFSKIFSRTADVKSIIEFGANIGLNLRALRQLLPKVSLTGIEINKSAAAELREWGGAEVLENSILDVELNRTWDFALIKGVLIHINPDYLDNVYERIAKASNRYICIAEYYNPVPVSVSYRGHNDRLFKRDFAGEMLDKFPSLRLIDYGFSYHRDPNFRQDDLTWFLLEKGAI